MIKPNDEGEVEDDEDGAFGDAIVSARILWCAQLPCSRAASCAIQVSHTSSHGCQPCKCMHAFFLIINCCLNRKKRTLCEVHAVFDRRNGRVATLKEELGVNDKDKKKKKKKSKD